MSTPGLTDMGSRFSNTNISANSKPKSNGSKCSVRDLGQSDLCKNLGKFGSLPCPFKERTISKKIPAFCQIPIHFYLNITNQLQTYKRTSILGRQWDKILKGHNNEAIFWGFCINRFNIGPLHYISSCSYFGFEFAEIFIIEKNYSLLIQFFQTFK